MEVSNKKHNFNALKVTNGHKDGYNNSTSLENNHPIKKADINSQSFHDRFLVNIDSYIRYLNLNLTPKLNIENGVSYLYLFDSDNSLIKKVSLISFITSKSMINEKI